jgi:hypothetical protein
MQDLRHGDQERGMRRLQPAIRKMYVQEEIGKFQRSESLGPKAGGRMIRGSSESQAVRAGIAVPAGIEVSLFCICRNSLR